MVVSITNLYNLDTAIFYNATSLNRINKSWSADFAQNSTFEIVVNFPEKLYLLIWSDDRFKYSAFSLNCAYINIDPDLTPLIIANKEYNKRKALVQYE
jgi:hypothetical protein